MESKPNSAGPQFSKQFPKKFCILNLVVLEVLDDSDSSIRELALSMLVEMLKKPDAMESSVEIVIEKLLNVTKDRVPKVWNACKLSVDDTKQLNHEIDVLSRHENDVNYVQFSGCAVASRFSISENWKGENLPKFKNSWLNHDNIVTCSRDGSAIIWIPKSRRSHGKSGRWTRAYHLRVPPPPMPPQPQRDGPCQRTLHIPRGVNMIVWSLDNRFVLVAIMGEKTLCEDALYSLLTFGCQRPVRHLASVAMAKIISKGDGISVYARVF
ncbi:hypothetical protein Ahy_A08g037717 isoform B [Arachis hypogaea]|uniref:Uncharacterized protein n=1 Tax=Arachis hypogaea TaxID=3818 RepID=A0A445BRP8_ARAHY|nr:hypothetical protein Ahy_A08g037717 isoform B [Arachis hypogaea]